MAIAFHSPPFRPVHVFLAAGQKKRESHDRPPAPWSDILDKPDDWLIRDIGLTREDILGPEEAFWSDWLKRKEPWRL